MPNDKPIFTGEWFPYYWKRFEESDKVALMSLTEEGAYHRAIRLAWKVRSLPGTPEMMAAKIQKRCTPKIAEKILATFISDPENPGRVIHPVVEEIREEQEAKHRVKVRGGKASAKARKQKTSNTTPTQLSSVRTQPLQTQDLRLKTKEEEFKTRESIAPVREIFIGTVTSEITQRLDLKTLPARLEWEHQAGWAHSNGFTSDDFLECYDLLKQQNWRDGPVKPKHVTENLPNLNKLRKEIEKQKNGTSSKNGNTDRRTSVDKLRDQSELLDDYPSEAELASVKGKA